MSERVEISNIEITIGETAHKLTLAQARALKNVLDELFPEPWPYQPVYVPPIMYREIPSPAVVPLQPWTITCQNNTLGLTLV